MKVGLRRWLLCAGVLVVVSASPASIYQGSAPSGMPLQVSFGNGGLERISFAGHVVSDVRRWPEDALHIWHMKCVDAHGRLVAGDGYGWGETKRTRTWDPVAHTASYQLPWGDIHIHYSVSAAAIDVETTVSNRQGSGIVFDGATVYPLTLHLGGSTASTSVTDNVEQPGVTFARWTAGVVAVVVPDATRPLYSGLEAGKDGAIAAIASGTRPDALPASQVALERPVRPGETDRFILSIRFAPPGTQVERMAQDVDRDFARHWPPLLDWKDRRVIGTVFLASSPSGEKTRPAGYPSNPRRYFNDAQLDVTTPAGLLIFQRRVLEQAVQITDNLRREHAQGVITWDIEGEQYPQDTSYVCAPDRIGELAPEMESVVAVAGSTYAGMKLDDAYFKTIRDAGFRVGVCIRPQHFTTGADRSARQTTLPNSEVTAELTRKMRYAHDRWGATLFYLDSTVRGDGTTLAAAEIEAAASALPDSLLMPEEATPRMYRASAPFLSFLFHGDLATPASVRAVYPQAFSVNLVNDVEEAKLNRGRAELTRAVAAGDILLIHADRWHPDNTVVEQIYRGTADARR